MVNYLEIISSAARGPWNTVVRGEFDYFCSRYWRGSCNSKEVSTSLIFVYLLCVCLIYLSRRDAHLCVIPALSFTRKFQFITLVSCKLKLILQFFLDQLPTTSQTKMLLVKNLVLLLILRTYY